MKSKECVFCGKRGVELQGNSCGFCGISLGILFFGTIFIGAIIVNMFKNNWLFLLYPAIMLFVLLVRLIYHKGLGGLLGRVAVLAIYFVTVPLTLAPCVLVAFALYRPIESYLSFINTLDKPIELLHWGIQLAVLPLLFSPVVLLFSIVLLCSIPVVSAILRFCRLRRFIDAQFGFERPAVADTTRINKKLRAISTWIRGIPGYSMKDWAVYTAIMFMVLLIPGIMIGLLTCDLVDAYYDYAKVVQMKQLQDSFRPNMSSLIDALYADAPVSQTPCLAGKTIIINTGDIPAYATFWDVHRAEEFMIKDAYMNTWPTGSERQNVSMICLSLPPQLLARSAAETEMLVLLKWLPKFIAKYSDGIGSRSVYDVDCEVTIVDLKDRVAWKTYKTFSAHRDWPEFFSYKKRLMPKNLYRNAYECPTKEVVTFIQNLQKID
jgi:hypothetical protein